jgi:hypothetical protein
MRTKTGEGKMQKLIGCVIGLALAFTLNARAETYVYEVKMANNTTNLSAALPVSGILNKIEISGFSAAVTGTVTVATYDGTTAVDTIVNLSALSANKIIRLMVQPTDNTGTVIPAVVSAGSTNTTTQLVVPYQPVMLGGNIKVRTINTDGNSIACKVVFYYERQLK